MTHPIVISNVAIHQDAEGRYSLNDLHKAAGGNPKHAPAQWMRLEQVDELIEAILNVQICTIKPVESRKGRYGGTYVCKELVYAYATWISAEFFLTVIRAYDELVSGRIEQSAPKTTVDERTPLRDAVNMLVSKKHLMYDEAYMLVHQRFNVDSITELAPEQIPQAIEYVHRIVIEGEYIGAEPPVSAIPDDLVYNVQCLALHYRAMYEAWQTQIYPALRLLNSPLAGCLIDRFKDGGAFLMQIELAANCRLKPGQRPRIR